MDLDLRVGRRHPRGHDVHPRVLQHLVRGEGRLERVHEAAHGRQQDREPAGGGAGPAGEAERRVRHLLPGDAVGEDHALQALLPRGVPAEVAVRAGQVSAVPQHPAQRGQRGGQGGRAHRAGGRGRRL